MSIKLDTINRYLHAVANVSILARQMDPRVDVFGTTLEHIKKVLREKKCREDMSSMREPVTQAMLDVMWDFCTDKDRDILEGVLHYWNILGKSYIF